jgi:hypothetical protein
MSQVLGKAVATFLRDHFFSVTHISYVCQATRDVRYCILPFSTGTNLPAVSCFPWQIWEGHHDSPEPIQVLLALGTWSTKTPDNNYDCVLELNNDVNGRGWGELGFSLCMRSYSKPGWRLGWSIWSYITVEAALWAHGLLNVHTGVYAFIHIYMSMDRNEWTHMHSLTLLD